MLFRSVPSFQCAFQRFGNNGFLGQQAGCIGDGLAYRCGRVAINQIGRASCRKECGSKCRSRWTTDHEKKKYSRDRIDNQTIKTISESEIEVTATTHNVYVTMNTH